MSPVLAERYLGIEATIAELQGFFITDDPLGPAMGSRSRAAG